MIFGALVCWIPLVSFNILFEDIARTLFSIPRERDAWWKWLLVLLFGLLIEGMLVVSYIVYIKKFGKKEGFGWEDLTKEMLNDYSPYHIPLRIIFTIYNDLDNLFKKYSSNVSIKKGLDVFKTNVDPIWNDLNSLTGIIPMEAQYNLLVSLKSTILKSVKIINFSV